MTECLEVMWPRARAWLERVRAASAAIEPLVREMSGYEDARDSMLPWRSTPRGGGSAIGAHSDPTASQAERRMAELEDLIADRRRRLVALQDVVGECGGVLARMAEELGERHAKAMELYYVDVADTWSDVAREMGVSYRHLGRIRNQAYAWIEDRCRKFLV